MTPPPPRRPLLPATFRGVSAAWLWRRVSDHVSLSSVAADLARVAGEDAGRELSRSLAELEEAARQWSEWAAANRSGSAIGTAEPADSEPAARSSHEISTTEAAGLLGVSDAMVRRWCRDGRLVARRPAGSWLVGRGSVLDLLDARRSAA